MFNVLMKGEWLQCSHIPYFTRLTSGMGKDMVTKGSFV